MLLDRVSIIYLIYGITCKYWFRVNRLYLYRDVNTLYGDGFIGMDGFRIKPGMTEVGSEYGSGVQPGMKAEVRNDGRGDEWRRRCGMMVGDIMSSACCHRYLFSFPKQIGKKGGIKLTSKNHQNPLLRRDSSQPVRFPGAQDPPNRSRILLSQLFSK